jgi:hypothetical protein
MAALVAKGCKIAPACIVFEDCLLLGRNRWVTQKNILSGLLRDGRCSDNNRKQQTIFAFKTDGRHVIFTFIF